MAIRQGPQVPKMMDPSPFNWEHRLYMLSPTEFKTRYRLSIEAFKDLVEMLRLERNDGLCCIGRARRYIPSEIMHSLK